MTNAYKEICNAFWAVYKAQKKAFEESKGIIRDDRGMRTQWLFLMDFFVPNHSDKVFDDVFGKYAEFAKTWLNNHKIQFLNTGCRFVKCDNDLEAHYNSLVNPSKKEN